MNTDNAFFESLCQISNLAIIGKMNNGVQKEQAMTEVAKLIAVYLNAIIVSVEDKDENTQSIHPDFIINFIKEQYKV